MYYYVDTALLWHEYMIFITVNCVPKKLVSKCAKYIC